MRFSSNVFRKKKVFRIFSKPSQAKKDAGRPSFREKIIDSRGCILNFRYLFGRYIDLCVSTEAFLDRKRVGSLRLVRLDFWFRSK